MEGAAERRDELRARAGRGGFHIVTTVFFSSLFHQWSELYFVFKYYGTAARRLEAVV